jgi:hypothetical protein
VAESLEQTLKREGYEQKKTNAANHCEREKARAQETSEATARLRLHSPDGIERIL